MGKSKIEWTQITWNPVTGCTKYSPGCKNCYAERMTRRLQAMGLEKYKYGFDVVNCDGVELWRPRDGKWPDRSVVFVNSMSDLFHSHVDLLFIRDVFRVMNDARAYVFHVLTKRSGRLREISSSLPWGENIWMGVSVENQDYLFRIDHLRECGAKHKFISFEPLLGPLGRVDLSGIDWVIVGGESGPGARPLREEWVLPIRDQCAEMGIPFFFKQWGGVNKKKNGALLQGKEYKQTPEYRFINP